MTQSRLLILDSEKNKSSFGGTIQTGAISFEEREALAYDEAAVMAKKNGASGALGQWPVQIKLVPLQAPYFQAADLLIAADCTAYAYGNFHAAFMQGKITLIGCPKLDEGDYSEKLAEIFRLNDIKSVTLARMSVPCCGGLARAVQSAVQKSGKELPLQIVVISPDGAAQSAS